MKTLVLGSAGQLGRDLIPALPGEVIPLTRADTDLTDTAALRDLLDKQRPTHLINCAAYNFVDKAESEPEVAFAVNSWALRELAKLCAEFDVVLVHFSTDYVFGLDAGRDRPWLPSDTPGPISVYGLSKLAGEYFVRSLAPKHFVIRVCGLYGVWGSGGKGGNFVETMLRLAAAGRPLRVVNDQFCTPTYTADVARTTVHLAATNAYGLYHVTNAGACSWYEFAAAIFRLSDLCPSLTPIPTSEYPTAARRPSYSVLDCSGLTELGIPLPRPWPEALAAYLEARKQRRSAPLS